MTLGSYCIVGGRLTRASSSIIRLRLLLLYVYDLLAVVSSKPCPIPTLELIYTTHGPHSRH